MKDQIKKKKQCIDKAARFTRWCNTAAADADFARSGSHKCIKVVAWVEVMEGRETFLR